MLRSPRWFDRHRSTFLVALLLLTLALTVTLAYQAVRSAHWHQKAAEQALRDYAAVAAWDYSLNLKEKFYGVLTTALGPVERIDLRANGGRLPPPDLLVRPVSHAARCPTPAQDSARYYFRVDLRDGSIATAGAPLSPALRRQVRDAVAGHALAKYADEWTYAQITIEVEGRDRTLAYAVKRDRDRRPVAAYGFESCMGAWGESIFASIMKHADLLPPALTAGVPNDSLFSVRVTDATGVVLYRSSPAYPKTYSAASTIGEGYGGLVTHVSLSPRAAGLLVIGGPPPSRVAFLLGLLLLTVGLVAVALLQLRREAELGRLRSRFISSVSHELRTPLAQIRMFAETLLLGRVRSDEERRRSLQIIDQEARRLAHLVENVLQFSRTERSVTHLSPEARELAGEVLDAMEGFAPIAAARSVRLVPQLGEGIVASVDRYALRQILLNLLDNAVKYGPAGQTLTVSLWANRERAYLAVADEGPGIEEKDRARIWEPFYRRDRDASSAVAGSGIGLSVVRELVALHGGRVWVEGGRGRGARFVVELPRSLPPGTPDGRPAGSPSEAEKTTV